MILRLLLVSILAGLVACSKPQSTELPFETIERRSGAEMGQSEMEEPGLVIITSPDGVAQHGRYFTHDARSQLQNLDWSAYFAVGVFHGKTIRRQAHDFSQAEHKPALPVTPAGHT